MSFKLTIMFSHCQIAPTMIIISQNLNYRIIYLCMLMGILMTILIFILSMPKLRHANWKRKLRVIIMISSNLSFHLELIVWTHRSMNSHKIVSYNTQLHSSINSNNSRTMNIILLIKYTKYKNKFLRVMTFVVILH